MPGTSQRPVLPEAWLWLLAALPVLGHAALLWAYAANAPRLDDFSETLPFLVSYHAASDLAGKLEAFFSLYRGHRHTLSHAAYLIGGMPLDFRQVTLAGFPLLLGYAGLFMWLFRQERHRAWLGVIAACLLFNLQVWRGTFWALGAWGTQAVLILAFASFVLVRQRHPLLFAAGLACAVSSTFTYANGVFVWPVLAAWTLATTGWRGSWRQGRAWAIAITGALALCAFLQDYTLGMPGSSQPPQPEPGSRLAGIPAGVLAMAGSLLLYNDPANPWKNQLAVAIGLVVCIGLAVLARREAARRYPELLMLTGFILLSMLAIAAGRASLAGLEQSLQGHYKLYNSSLLLVLASWLVLHRAAARQAVTLLAVLLAVAGAVLFTPALRNYQQGLADDTRNWLHSNTLRFAETRLYAAQPNRKLREAVDAGVYDPWSLVPASQQPVQRDSVTCPPAGDALPAQASSQRRALAIHIEAELAAPARQLLLCSPGESYAITLADNALARNTNGTYSLQLWVPRTNGRDDAGPWQVRPGPTD